MDWTLSEAEATSGAEGMEAFLRRTDAQLRGDGGPIEGFTFLNDAREMLRISREIEGDLLATSSPTRLYVGFQNGGKFELEFERYRELRRSGVSVFAFGEGEPDAPAAAAAAADAWYSLPTDHRKLENQWYLVTRQPEPVAFVGWEISQEALWGEHGISHPDKRFVGFISQDARMVHAVASHLDIVRASNRAQPGGGGSLRDVTASLAPRRLGLLADDGKREHVQRVLDRFASGQPLPQCDLYLYDLASASYLLDPYPYEEVREPFGADYVRNAVRRAYLADRMERLPADGQVMAVLPTGVGFGDLGEWAERLELDAIVLPVEYEQPGLLDRIRGYTVGTLRDTTSAAVVVDDPDDGPRVLRRSAIPAPA